MTEEISDEAALAFLSQSMAANDIESLEWTKECVEHAQFLWNLRIKRVPSVLEIQRHVGIAQVEALTPLVVERRRFHNALMAHWHPCHYCKGTEELRKCAFALMRVEETKRDWAGAAVSAAVSAATIPLLGAGLFRLPGIKQRGAVLRANFVVCKNCRREHGNWLGAFVLNRDRASWHPHWNELQEAGFTKFFDEWELGKATVTASPYAALWL